MPSQVSDDDVVDALRDAVESNAAPVATASEVAERVSIGQRATSNRLDDLVDERVGRKDVGARATAWWPLEPGGSDDSGDVRSSEARPRSSEVRSSERVASGDVPSSEPSSVERTALDLPGSGPKLEARRDAVLAAYEYLLEHGEATRSDFEADVYPDHPAQYDGSYSWWNNCVIRGLKQVAEIDERVLVPDTAGDWRVVAGE